MKVIKNIILHLVPVPEPLLITVPVLTSSGSGSTSQKVPFPVLQSCLTVGSGHHDDRLGALGDDDGAGPRAVLLGQGRDVGCNGAHVLLKRRVVTKSRKFFLFPDPHGSA
jgi:hypothetical protein